MVTKRAQKGLIELRAGWSAFEHCDHPLSVGRQLRFVLHAIPLAQHALSLHDLFPLRTVSLAGHRADLIVAGLGHGCGVARRWRRALARIC